MDGGNSPNLNNKPAPPPSNNVVNNDKDKDKDKDKNPNPDIKNNPPAPQQGGGDFMNAQEEYYNFWKKKIAQVTLFQLSFMYS